MSHFVRAALLMLFVACSARYPDGKYRCESASDCKILDDELAICALHSERDSLRCFRRMPAVLEEEAADAASADADDLCKRSTVSCNDFESSDGRADFFCSNTDGCVLDDTQRMAEVDNLTNHVFVSSSERKDASLGGGLGAYKSGVRGRVARARVELDYWPFEPVSSAVSWFYLDFTFDVETTGERTSVRVYPENEEYPLVSKLEPGKMVHVSIALTRLTSTTARLAVRCDEALVLVPSIAFPLDKHLDFHIGLSTPAYMDFQGDDPPRVAAAYDNVRRFWTPLR